MRLSKPLIVSACLAWLTVARILRVRAAFCRSQLQAGASLPLQRVEVHTTRSSRGCQLFRVTARGHRNMGDRGCPVRPRPSAAHDREAQRRGFAFLLWEASTKLAKDGAKKRERSEGS